MLEYHKIDTIFERDMEGSKKLIEGKFRNPAVEYLKDVVWIGKEKIDGTNIRIYWDGHKISYAGRTDKSEIPKDLVQYIEDKFCTSEAEQLFEQLFGEKEVYLFAEGYGAGIQNGGSYRLDQALILFDVCVNGTYLDMESVNEIAKAFDIEVVKILCEGTIDELVSFVKSSPKSQSAIDKDLVIEGVVAVPKVELRTQNGKRLIVKIKVKDFM